MMCLHSITDTSEDEWESVLLIKFIVYLRREGLKLPKEKEKHTMTSSFGNCSYK
jgi:hypothetical protein